MLTGLTKVQYLAPGEGLTLKIFEVTKGKILNHKILKKQKSRGIFLLWPLSDFCQKIFSLHPLDPLVSPDYKSYWKIENALIIETLIQTTKFMNINLPFNLVEFGLG
jgi:hypothetical protein